MGFAMVELSSELCVWPASEAARRWWPNILTSVSAAIQNCLAGTTLVGQAHVRRSQAEAVTDETVSDVGLSRDDILGGASWQKDLPFFMQQGFR